MNHSLRLATYLFAIFSLACFSNPASAAWIETFNGSYDQSWTFFNHLGASPPTHTTLSVASNSLTMFGTTPNGTTFDQSVAGLVDLPDTSKFFNDVVVKATVSSIPSLTTALGNNDIFVAARSDGTNAYILALDFWNGDVEMGRTSAGGVYNDFPGAGNSASIAGFNPSLSYDLVLSAIGDLLTGKVYQAGNEVASVSYNTAPDAIKLTEGWSGIGAALNPEAASAGITLIAARFDNVSSVPEPGSILLMLGSVVGLIAFKCRKK